MLRDFLEQYKVNEKPYSHTCISDKWRVPDNKLDDFFEEYSNIKYTENIYEKHRNDKLTPVIAKFIIYQKEKRELFNNKLIDYFAKVLTDHVMEIFIGNYECYVLKLKNIFKKDKLFFNCFYFYFPNIVSCPEYQYYLREKCLPIFSGLLHNIIIDDIESVYDKNVIYRCGVLMYGSSFNNEEYVVFNTYNGASLLPTNLDYIKKFSIRNKSIESPCKLFIDKTKYDDEAHTHNLYF